MVVNSSPDRHEHDPVVRTAGGSLAGTWSGPLAVFRGIRFAEPPVGEHRFRAPEPVSRWDGVRPATEFGPPPPQPVSFVDTDIDADATDWLTLNVWTPALDRRSMLPVMVWLPGGAYVVGGSGFPEYDGGHLTGHDVVVVTVNYRLGFEGFGWIEGAPANRGLLDQVAALAWVQENIRSFGGDPDRVTVFGQSAGGGSVAALLATPRASGLFRRAIAQSVPGTFLTPELAADIATAFADELNKRPTVSDLTQVPPMDLVAAGEAVSAAMAAHSAQWGQITHRPIPLAPIVDGDVLPMTPWEALSQGRGRDIDLLVGHTRDEHRLFSLLDGVLGEVTAAQTDSALRVLAPGSDGPQRFRESFPAASDEELYELVNEDWLFRMPSRHLADAQIAGGGRAFLYELTMDAPGMGGVLGACHGFDVPLVFGNLDAGRPAMLIGDPIPPAVTELSARMGAAWTAFAAHGDPGWPAFDVEAELTQVFDAVAVVTRYPEQGSRMLWQDHPFAALPLLSP
ncbi:carboxylesterase family protein [Gordonia sp. CPCC 205515]|uniref:carboxylesterase/lipase family protein n=1 Tax=Gordonia sp. CPCC 205515 TaxID=3140791 RepID=UPI003AF3636E